MLWQLLAVVGTFLVVGYGTMHLLVAHAVRQGAPEYSVRLGGAVGGLFAGGAAAVVVGLVVVLGRKGGME